MKKGEIYAPRWRYKDCTHYVVIMEDCDDNAEFVDVCLITHSVGSVKYKYRNRGMKKNWFVERKANGRRYKIQFENSYFVCQPIEKAAYKLDLRKGVVGKINQHGVNNIKKYTACIQTIRSKKALCNNLV